jgi:predicted DNA-binding protein (MmcQ/YjbR family)
MSAKTFLSRLREMCLALPDTKETLTWGHPHFRVGEKIFCGYGDENGKTTITFKVTMDHQDALIMQDRFEMAAYVGRYGWVSMDASRIDDWQEVEELVLESYQLIASKRSRAKLGDSEPKTHRAPVKRRTGPGSGRKSRRKK